MQIIKVQPVAHWQPQQPTNNLKEQRDTFLKEYLTRVKDDSPVEGMLFAAVMVDRQDLKPLVDMFNETLIDLAVLADELYYLI